MSIVEKESGAPGDLPGGGVTARLVKAGGRASRLPVRREDQALPLPESNELLTVYELEPVTIL